MLLLRLPQRKPTKPLTPALGVQADREALQVPLALLQHIRSAQVTNLEVQQGEQQDVQSQGQPSADGKPTSLLAGL